MFLNYLRQCFEIGVVFHTFYLWNDVRDPECFLAFLTPVTYDLTAVRNVKTLSTGTFFFQTSLRSNFTRIQFTNLFRILTESRSDEGYLETLKIRPNLPWGTTQNVTPRVVAYESLDHNGSKFSWLEYGNCQDLTHGPMPIQCFIHAKAVVEKKTRFLPQRNFRFL